MTKRYVRVGGVLEYFEICELFDELCSNISGKSYYTDVNKYPTLSWNLSDNKINGYCDEEFYKIRGYEKVEISEILINLLQLKK